MNRHFFNLIIGQKAVIVNDKKELLILKRKNVDVYHELWDFPGGKLEEKDTLFEGLSREVLEETGLKIENFILILSSSKFTGVSSDKPTILRNIYLCKANGEVKLSDEHSEFKWIRAEKLKNYKFQPDEDINNVIETLIKSLNSIDTGSNISSIS